MIVAAWSFFVQLHPDLHDELDLLLQSKLEPDTSVTYLGKEELLFGISIASLFQLR